MTNRISLKRLFPTNGARQTHELCLPRYNTSNLFLLVLCKHDSVEHLLKPAHLDDNFLKKNSHSEWLSTLKNSFIPFIVFAWTRTKQTQTVKIHKFKRYINLTICTKKIHELRRYMN